MPRASKRQTEVARLKELLDSAREVGEQRRVEINDLRKAARQLMAGLQEYAKDENWKEDYTWDGEGAGPHTARKFLGLEEENN